MNVKKVTTIQATINQFNQLPINIMKKRKVAGYARVSTDSEEQLTSYAAQLDYYTHYIKGREDWEYVGYILMKELQQLIQKIVTVSKE